MQLSFVHKQILLLCIQNMPADWVFLIMCCGGIVVHFVLNYQSLKHLPGMWENQV